MLNADWSVVIVVFGFASVCCTYSSICLIYLNLFNLFNLEMEGSDTKTLQLIELYEKRPYLCDKVAACNWTICNFTARLCCTLALKNCTRKLQVWHRSNAQINRVTMFRFKLTVNNWDIRTKVIENNSSSRWCVLCTAFNFIKIALKFKGQGRIQSVLLGLYEVLTRGIRSKYWVLSIEYCLSYGKFSKKYYNSFQGHKAVLIFFKDSVAPYIRCVGKCYVGFAGN